MNLRDTRIVVLDEADRMLDMGFIDDIKNILNNVPKRKQISLFSATLNSNVMKVCYEFMRYPEKVLFSKDEVALPQIEQHYVMVNSPEKLNA